jgi:tetratricopeptide (TPR) repeat protein
LYRTKGDLENALVHLQKGLEIQLKFLGSENRNAANSRNGVGNVLADMGKHEEALVDYQQAFKLFLAIMARSTRT